MGALADIFASVRLRLETGQFQAQAAKEADSAGTSMGKRLSASLKKSWNGQELGRGLVQGLGLAGGLGAANLATRAISGLVDAMGDAVAAAREDQASIAALDSSLRANVAGWDGNTEAIERTIKSRQRLGFADEEQRLSLQRLLPVYKDVDKALEVQRVAMDLARFKRVSLEEATLSLITTEAGQYRSLKQLIGSTKDITSATEALAAVRRAAGDAAEDMANTDEGRLLDAQLRQAEAVERLGYILMPAFTTATVTAADVVEDLAGNLDGLTSAASQFGDILELLGVRQEDAADKGFDLIHAGQDFLAVMNPTKVSNTVGVFLDTIDKLGVSTEEARKQLREMGLDVEVVADHSADAIERLKSSAGPDLGTVEDAQADVGEAADDMADEIRAAALGSAENFEKMKQSMVDDANDLIDSVFDPIITQDRLLATQTEIAAQRRILASKTATAAEKRDARERLHELTKDNAEYLLSLAEAGDTNNKAYKDGLRELKEEIKKAKGPAKAALQEVLDKIQEVERAGKTVPINLIVAAQTTQWAKNLAGNMRASGGPVERGVPYLVNEDTPNSEIFVPRQAGTVLTPEQWASGMQGGGDHSTNQVIVQGLLPVSTVADLRREMKMLSDVKRIRRAS